MKQPQAVAPLGRADMNRAHAHAEAPILGVAQPTLDAPALAVEAHQFFGSRVGAAGGQTPGLFHLLVLHAQHRPHLIAVGRHQGAAQDAGAPAGSNKGSGGARPCRVSSESMMVAWPSASKSVQSMATLMLVRDPTT